MNRNLDGIYFRVKRGEKYESICFSDMTEEEQDYVLDNQSVFYLKNMCKMLAQTLKEIGNEFDLVGGGMDENT